jgi:hypothetical protein
MEVYENLGEKVGKASQSSQRSACNKFDKFLSELQTIDSHSCPHTTLAEFSDDELGRFQNIFGRFPSFMLKDKLSMNTALHYLSQVHCFIRKRNRGSDIFYPEWYSHLNTQLENMYNKHASDTNTCIANSAPPMTESELHTLCKMLFARGTLVSSSQRSLLVLQWQALGRVSDITNMPMSRIDWYSNFDCLQLLMHRPKTNTDHPITVFLHSSDWLLCPLHALAMQIAFCSSSSERLFPLVPLNNPAQYINNLLGDLCSASEEFPEMAHEISLLKKKLTSHSNRAGPTTHAQEHPEIELQWCVPRGGWELGGLLTIFKYLHATTKTDGRVGRALSGWTHVERGGHCPTVACLPPNEQARFQYYATELLSMAPFCAELKGALACVLVMHAESVRAQFPEHPLLTKLERCGTIGRDKLEDWGKHIRRAFITKNAAYFPVRDMADSDASNTSCDLALPGLISIVLVVHHRLCQDTP